MNSLVDTSKLSYMKIGGKADSLFFIKSKEDIFKIKPDTIIIGEGSNSVFSSNLKKSLAKMEIIGIDIVKKNKKDVVIKVGAGENWDDFVKFCVNKKFSGIEALSGIPGSVGAAPVQNIGAYGSEVKDIILKIEAYDRYKKEFCIIKNKDCKFSYRNSIFKKYPHRWVILKVIFKLHYSYDRKNSVKIPNYGDIQKYFHDKKRGSVSLKEIRGVILEIRSKKLPDPFVIPNCGSFFKNPVISKNILEKIQKKYPEIPAFKFKQKIKIPAGFLIEKIGFKGKKIGKIEICKNNALVLTNPSKKASLKDLLTAKKTIEKKVFSEFGIKLEPEVNIYY